MDIRLEMFPKRSGRSLILCACCELRAGIPVSGRFVKQEQWECWRAKRKLVSGSKHQERFRGSSGYDPRKHFKIVYAKPYNLVHFSLKMVRNAFNNTFLNTQSVETAVCTHAFRQLFNNGNGVLTRSPLINDL